MENNKTLNPETCIATRAGTRAVLEKYGLHTRKRLGQHFLTDPFVLEKIIRASDINEKDCVLEIGPGIGAVTQALVNANAGHVLAVELDKDLVPVLRSLFAHHSVTICQGDILKLNLVELLKPFEDKNLKIVANLPYYVTTPVLMHVLENGPRFESVTVMVQKEVAQRMAAQPNTPAYGSLSLAMQYYADISIAAYVPPNCFMPRPKVDSAVVHMRIHKSPPVVFNKKILFDIIHAAFNQRRKTLVNALHAGLKTFTKAEIAEALTACGLAVEIRGEVLSMAAFAALADVLYNERKTK